MRIITSKKLRNIQTLIDGVRERNKNLRKENKQLLQSVHDRNAELSLVRKERTRLNALVDNQARQIQRVRGVCYAMDANWTSVEIAPEISDTGTPELDYIIARAKGQAPRALSEEERLEMDLIQMIKEMKW